MVRWADGMGWDGMDGNGMVWDGMDEMRWNKRWDGKGSDEGDGSVDGVDGWDEMEVLQYHPAAPSTTTESQWTFLPTTSTISSVS